MHLNHHLQLGWALIHLLKLKRVVKTSVFEYTIRETCGLEGLQYWLIMHGWAELIISADLLSSVGLLSALLSFVCILSTLSWSVSVVWDFKYFQHIPLLRRILYRKG